MVITNSAKNMIHCPKNQICVVNDTEEDMATGNQADWQLKVDIYIYMLAKRDPN